VVHHADYLDRRDGHALCGDALEAPVPAEPAGAVCPNCEARLVEYHLTWWRQQAEAATAELEALRVRYRDLEQRAGVATSDPAAAGDPTPSTGDTFLDRARRELMELCRQFNGAVPYFRLKNAMQAFSDRLDDGERVDLAREVGADGSLIRWATTEVEKRGWQVTNSPVQESTEMMWEEWLQESQQPATKTKRRFGRSR
jgi:hypothetical protein